MKKLIVLILVCLFVTGCGETTSNKNGDDRMISVSEVKEIIDNYSDYSNVYIVDVREEYEYGSGHLKNSINIPLSVLETIDYDKKSKIIVYCQSGRRSANAVSILEDLGYTNIYDMGGINSWSYDIEK